MLKLLNSQPNKLQIYGQINVAGTDETYDTIVTIRDRNEYIEGLEIWPLYLNGNVGVVVQLLDFDASNNIQSTITLPGGKKYPGFTTLLQKAMGQLDFQPQFIPIKLNYSGRVRIIMSSDNPDNQVMLILKNSLQGELK